MRKLAGSLVLLGLLIAFPSQAARLTTTFTTPAFEASVSGPDTCAAGTAPEISPLLCRRCWSGPSVGCDSLANVPPNTAVQMLTAVPSGFYTVTVDVRDEAGNWSCPVSGSKLIRGRPSRVLNFQLGWHQGTTEAELAGLWRLMLLESLHASYQEGADAQAGNAQGASEAAASAEAAQAQALLIE